MNNFNPENVSAKIHIELPLCDLKSARTTSSVNSQYNIKLIIHAKYAEMEIINNDFYVPVMLGSRLCLTYGKSQVERQEMGISIGDCGGYICNPDGGFTILRSMESSHPSRPKICFVSSVG